MSDKTITINITTGTFFRAILVVILLIFLYLIRDLVAVILLSVVIASGVEPAAQWFQKRKIPRVISVIIVYFIAFVLLGCLFYLIIPPIFSELSELIESIPIYLERPFATGLIHQFLPQLPESISQLILGLAEDTRKFIGRLAEGFFRTTSLIFGGALSFILVIVFSFYLSVQERGIENFLRLITPRPHENYVIDLWLRSRNKIGGWLKGQILLGILVGVLVFLGLTILRIKYAFTFALLAAVFELIPIFGPILASIPAIGVAFLQSPTLALLVALVYFLIQQFENHLIYPLVVKKIIGITPIITILALVIGGKIGGFVGILLSIPVATVLMEFINDIEKKKKSI